MKRLICAIVVAMLLVSILSACSRPVIPMFASPLHKVYIPLIATPRHKYFAWALEWDSRISVQLSGLDTRQERQYTCTASLAGQFALAHPGQLYIACDEPDIYGTTPHDYAIWYHDFISVVRAADPLARFSPAGFALTSPGLHFTEYAQAFSDEYKQLYGTVPPVDEWRFHAFICNPADIAWWKQKVNQASVWSAAHGAKMTLGSFGMPCVTPAPDIRPTMQVMHDFVEADPNIMSAVWWSMDWYGSPHTLKVPGGSLSQEGELYRTWE